MWFNDIVSTVNQCNLLGDEFLTFKHSDGIGLGCPDYQIKEFRKLEIYANHMDFPCLQIVLSIEDVIDIDNRIFRLKKSIDIWNKLCVKTA